MPIDSKHKEFEKYAPIWKKIHDITELENLGDYLIPLNPQDQSEQNKYRNLQYKESAVFYPIAQNMADALQAQLFSKEPKLEVPSQLEYVMENVDGSGNSLFQQSHQTAYDVIRMSRGGLYTSFPRTEGGVSMADMQSGRVFATIHRFKPSQIINWQKTNIGAKSVLSKIIIQDKEENFEKDEYEPEYVDVIKELALIEGIFRERTWRKLLNKDRNAEEWIPDEWYAPTDGAGNTWDEIPFSFVGATNNDSIIDRPLLQGMVNMNIGHYRNSADYEDSVRYVGQAQPWMSGVTQTHVDLMEKNEMYIGSRSLIGVPPGERFGFESAQPNILVSDAMAKKVDLMIMMGAKLMTPSGREKKEVEVLGEQQMQSSALSVISKNISEAYTKHLEYCGRFMNVDASEAFYETTDDFSFHKWDANELREMVAGFLSGAIAPADYHNWLKKNQLTDEDKPLDEFLEEVSQSGSLLSGVE